MVGYHPYMSYLKQIQGKSRKLSRQSTHLHKQNMLAKYKEFSQPICNHIVCPAIIHCDFPSIFYKFSDLMHANANVFALRFMGSVFEGRK